MCDKLEIYLILLNAVFKKDFPTVDCDKSINILCLTVLHSAKHTKRLSRIMHLFEPTPQKFKH